MKAYKIAIGFIAVQLAFLLVCVVLGAAIPPPPKMARSFTPEQIAKVMQSRATAKPVPAVYYGSVCTNITTLLHHPHPSDTNIVLLGEWELGEIEIRVLTNHWQKVSGERH